MTFQFHPIVMIYFSACAIALFMVYYGRKMAPIRGTRIWGLAMLFLAIWSAGDGLEILMADLPLKLICLRITYLGIVGTILFWPYFVIVYSNNDRLLTPKAKVILSIVPIATYLLVLSHHLHSYFFKSIELINTNGISELSIQHGPLFWVWSIYAYCAMFGSGVLLIQSMLHFPSQFRGQIYMLIIAGLLPLIPNFLYITGNNFIEPFDPTVIAFTISGLLVGVSLRRFRFLDVMPVAHELVFNHVNSGVIVIDNRGVVIDINPAAGKIINRSQEDAVGKTLQQTLSGYSHLLDVFSNEVKETSEVRVGSNVYEIKQTPLIDMAGKHTGRIMLLYDITTLKNSEDKLSAANDQLQKLAATDTLTQLFNRRNFFELADREFSRAQRQQICFSLILIDLDNFKTVNDTKGHICGDMVLQEAARCLGLYSRDGDILGRYGGDEFIVLAFEADEQEARLTAERFCEKIPAHLASLEGVDIPVTLSIGVATYNKEADTTLNVLLERADKALYESKRNGRNQTAVWQAGGSEL
ncbi:MAG: diguanylate cyclase [Chloroflexi bacterium]|nr:diguanylate cyclase [Chloroflexota bacterium]